MNGFTKWLNEVVLPALKTAWAWMMANPWIWFVIALIILFIIIGAIDFHRRR